MTPSPFASALVGFNLRQERKTLFGFFFLKRHYQYLHFFCLIWLTGYKHHGGSPLDTTLGPSERQHGTSLPSSRRNRRLTISIAHHRCDIMLWCGDVLGGV